MPIHLLSEQHSGAPRPSYYAAGCCISSLLLPDIKIDGIALPQPVKQFL